MEERRQPSFDPEVAARAIADGVLPDPDLPVIDIRDLEHQSWPDARVGKRGAGAQPGQMDELIRRESGVVKVSEDARSVGAEIAKHFRKLPKGREIF